MPPAKRSSLRRRDTGVPDGACTPALTLGDLRKCVRRLEEAAQLHETRFELLDLWGRLELSALLQFGGVFTSKCKDGEAQWFVLLRNSLDQLFDRVQDVDEARIGAAPSFWKRDDQTPEERQLDTLELLVSSLFGTPFTLTREHDARYLVQNVFPSREHRQLRSNSDARIVFHTEDVFLPGHPRQERLGRLLLEH